MPLNSHDDDPVGWSQDKPAQPHTSGAADNSPATKTRQCLRCAGDNPLSASRCALCGSALASSSPASSSSGLPLTPITVVGGGILLLAIAGAFYGVARAPVPPEGNASTQASPSLGNPTTSDMPEAQSALCLVLAQSRSVYQGLLAEKANELRLSKERSARRKRLLEALPDGTFEDWSGQITSLKTNSEGKAALAVSLPCDAMLKTSVSAVGDSGRDTLIPQGSPLYETLAALHCPASIRNTG